MNNEHKEAMRSAWDVLNDLVETKERLAATEAALAHARDILVFADGFVLASNQKYSDYDFVLADLYAEECEWAQTALREAGCYERGKFRDRLNEEIVPDQACVFQHNEQVLDRLNEPSPE